MVVNTIAIHGIQEALTSEGVEVSYVYPGALTTKLTEGVTMSANPRVQEVELGLLLEGQDPLVDASWRWEANTKLATRRWAQHVLDASLRKQSVVYEHGDEVVVIWAFIPARADELTLLEAGFTPAMASWRAPATPVTRTLAAQMVARRPGQPMSLGKASPPSLVDADLDERRDWPEHTWMRWAALTENPLWFGNKKYKLRKQLKYGDDLVLEYTGPSSDLNLVFSTARHPLVYEVTIRGKLGQEPFFRVIPSVAWEDFESLFAELHRIVTGQKMESLERVAVGDFPPPRPRAGAAAVKAVALRLRKLLTGSVRIGRYNFHSPDSEAIGDEVLVRFTSSDGSRLVLNVAPRHDREMDLRGELIDENGSVVRRFDWTVIQLVELIALDEASFARWFGVPVEPRRPAPPAPVGPSTRSASNEAANEAAEEAHMGRALRAARDQEEAAWDEALRRGIAYEMATQNLDHEAARKAAVRNLATNFNHYDAVRSTEKPAPENKYEDARAAIKALGLPSKKYAYYVRRAEEAIGDGKAWAPIVARARKAADKLSGATKPSPRAAKQAEARPAAHPSAINLILDTFNAQPLWRVDRVRPRANGFVLAVFPEGKNIDAAVVSLDVVNGEIDEVRWLDERLPQRDRDAILDRLERSLWDALEEDDEDDDDDNDAAQPPSPLQELIDLMERRSKELGARPAATADLGRKDGYGPIAEALRDLARPTGPTVEELQRWLEAEDLTSASEVVARARGGEPMPVRQLMRDLWAGVFDTLTRDEVLGRPGALRLPAEAIFQDDDRSGDFVLQRVQQGERNVLRRIRVRVGDPDADTDEVEVEDPSERLSSGDVVHRAERTERFFVDLYGKLGTFHDDLERAPRTLHEVRMLLYWAAVMLDAPLCQGDVKARAAAAFTQAKGFHDTARRALIDGRNVDAVRRMQAALERISTAAAQIARSCAEGQLEILATPPGLPVSPEDVSVMRASMGPMALASGVQGAVVSNPKPPTVMMALVKPTPEELRERFTTPARKDVKPIHYIFRSRSGLPQLLTREEIEAQAREAVGHEVYDEAQRNPMPGADLFESAIGAVELLLDAEFEGRADPRWASAILKEKQA